VAGWSSVTYVFTLKSRVPQGVDEIHALRQSPLMEAFARAPAIRSAYLRASESVR